MDSNFTKHFREFLNQYDDNAEELRKLTIDFNEVWDENTELKKQNQALLAEIGRLHWENMRSSAISQKANRRKWGARCS